MGNTVPWSDSPLSVPTSSTPAHEFPNARLRRSDDLEEGEGENEQSPLLPPRSSDDGQTAHVLCVLNIHNNINSEDTLNQYDMEPPRNDNSSQYSSDQYHSNHPHSSPGDTSNPSNMEHPQDNKNMEQSRSVGYLFRSTACFFGIQFSWAVEQLEVAPFLLHLGIRKELMAVIWLAGPFSGIFVQPYIGMKSDKHRSRFGKRRPFMVKGAIATIVSLSILVWSFDITLATLKVFDLANNLKMLTGVTIALAVIMFVILDISMNTLQAASRALVIDSAPIHQQDIANAWATRVAGIGDITGFMFGYVKLGRYLHFVGDNQFKGLGVLTSVAILVFTAITVLTIKEPRTNASQPRHVSDERASIHSHGSGDSERSRKSLIGFYKELVHVMKRLPPQIKNVCLIQIAAWVGWFPVLFYTSSWIDELHKTTSSTRTPDPEEGTRLGSLGLFIKAVVTLVCSVVFPWMVRQVDVLTLKRMWLASHLLFAVSALLTFAVKNVNDAIFLIACMGVPWAITLWVPYALIAAEMKSDGVDDDTGMILGIHNMAIAVPQLISITVSAGIFHSLQGPHGQNDPESTAWMFRVGGVMALVAAGLTLRLRDEKAHDE